MSRKILESLIVKIPETTGVYRMLDSSGTNIYIGKAKNLRKRLSQYCKPLSIRLEVLLNEVCEVKFDITRTEVEACRLEASLIKKIQPKYNILLKDDKYAPYIYINYAHKYPNISIYRGKENKNCYGPFSSTIKAFEIIKLIKKAFLVRSCRDKEFLGRLNPCIEYQLSRCSAPCVAKISEEGYRSLVNQATDVLKGKIVEVQSELVKLMKNASDAQRYEMAILYRDRIRLLNGLSERNKSLVEGVVYTIFSSGYSVCVQKTIFRNKQHCGVNTYFFNKKNEESLSEVLENFIFQFYNEDAMDVYLAMELDPIIVKRINCFINANVFFPRRGYKAALLSELQKDTQLALQSKESSYLNLNDFRLIQSFFSLEHLPSKIEVYDNSHIRGAYPVGVKIVVGVHGFIKAAYKRYNIVSSKLADDYGMMHEVLSRRFAKDKIINNDAPDLILIDGGYSHLSTIQDIIQPLGVVCAAISKGEKRKRGLEKIHMIGSRDIDITADDPLFYFLQKIRDEAHRFAVSSHTKKRNVIKSDLDDIKGIGPQRKKTLLIHFGSVECIKNSSIETIAAVPGIGRSTAKIIWRFFNKI